MWNRRHQEKDSPIDRIGEVLSALGFKRSRMSLEFKRKDRSAPYNYAAVSALCDCAYALGYDATYTIHKSAATGPTVGVGGDSNFIGVEFVKRDG